MRTPEEQTLALDCLRVANGDVEKAKEMLAFVLGDSTGELRDEQAWKDLEGSLSRPEEAST
jgi:hypothetical protein